MHINGEGTAKFIGYILGKIALAAIAVMLIIGGFLTGLASTNVHVVVRDAFTKRASVMLGDEENADSEIILKLFTADCIADAGLMKSIIADPEISVISYNERTDVPYMAVFPWQDTVTMTVKDQIKDVKLETAKDVIVDPNTLGIPSGEYEVKLIKKADGGWIISGIELKKVIDVFYDVPQPSPTTSAEAAAEAEAEEAEAAAEEAGASETENDQEE